MIVLTGATGFIGSHVVEALCARGEPVRCLVRPDYQRRRSFALPPAAEPVYGDLLSGAGLDDAIQGAKAVIHLAGVTKALSDDDYYQGNVAATRNLARAIAGSLPSGETRLVHVSSLAAIGPASEGAPVDEASDPHPVTHYGKSKLEGERIVRELVPSAVIVRPPVVYGPRDTDVFQMLKSISKGLMVEIAGGARWFQAIYVKDLAEALLAAVRAPQGCGRSYFLGHADPVSWEQFAACAARVMGKRLRTVRVPLALASAAGAGAGIWSRLTGKPAIMSREKVREAECRYWTCDTRRAARELGFEARTSLECGLAETLHWYKEAGWLKY